MPVGAIFDVGCHGKFAKQRVTVSAILLVLVYLCIVMDVVHRTLVAMVGSFCALFLLACTATYHTSMETAIIWMDEGTLALLFGMMIIVNLVSTTGLFEWIAIRVSLRASAAESQAQRNGSGVGWVGVVSPPPQPKYFPNLKNLKICLGKIYDFQQHQHTHSPTHSRTYF